MTSIYRRHPATALVLGLLLIFVFRPSIADTRQLLYPPSLPEPLPHPVQMILAGDAAPRIPYEQLELRDRWLTRLVPRKHVIDAAGSLKADGFLGTKEFVFASTPESVQGKSLLELYLDIGYEASDVFRSQLGQEMVLLLFRPAADIGIWSAADGSLPENWREQIYVPTWETVFALFERMARDAEIDADREGELAPRGTFFRSAASRDFVLSYPDSGKSRIRATSYEVLLGLGGADCTYRRLLERKLSIFRHFKGDGRTHNEVLFGNAFVVDTGLLEFLVPNSELGDLDELYVVSVGKLSLEGADPEIFRRQAVVTDRDCNVLPAAGASGR